jgi:hypothetical protein
MPYGMDAGETLVFWLHGYADALDPLGSGRQPLVQLDPTRLKPTRIVNGFPLYHYSPSHGQGQPYVYIHHASYNTLAFTPAAPGTGAVRAYKSSLANNEFINADSFQIISAGLDGDYGAASADKQFPAGLNYASGDRDNITNFSGGALRNQLP